MRDQFILVLATVLVGGALQVGCEAKAPTPKAVSGDGEGTASGLRKLGIPTKEYERDYRSIPHDVHGPAAHLNPPPSHVSGEVTRIDVGDLTFEPPEGWEYQHPASAMRRAELGVRGEDGTAGLVVFYFGSAGAGSQEANIRRWVEQFRNPDGSRLTDVQPAKRKIGGLDVTEVEVAGSYASGMGDDAAQQREPGQRMIASIVDTPKGPYYFKFLGDDTVVKENREAYRGLLSSLKASE